MTARSLSLAALIGGLLIASTRADDPPISVADLADYRTAIDAKLDPSAISTVTFADLWDHPEAHQGHQVQVEGRLARLFRQPGVGQFPPLAEAWITSPRGEPICVVFPTKAGSDAPRTGDQVRFAGTFLRRIAYQGGDTKRLAPLIVGPSLPAVLAADSTTATNPLGPIFGNDHAADWGIGLMLGSGVVWYLLRRHLSRPPVLAPPIGPSPAFLDGDPLGPFDSGGDSDDDH